MDANAEPAKHGCNVMEASVYMSSKFLPNSLWVPVNAPACWPDTTTAMDVGTVDPQVLRHVVDVHCHPTDASIITPDSMERLPITVCAMSSRPSDQLLVRDLATNYPSKVIPAFGQFFIQLFNFSGHSDIV